MAYGDVTGVLARAGALAAAFVEGQPVGPAELDQFVLDSAAVIDVNIAARGFGVPVTDSVAVAALAPINDDMALLLAIDANWPGSTARDDVADLRAQVQKRVDSYMESLRDGELAVLMYLGALAAAGGHETSGGAASFWSEDALTYDWWQRFVDTRWGLWADPWGVPSGQQSEFRKDMPL